MSLNLEFRDLFNLMFCNSCHQWVKELHQKLKTPQNKQEMAGNMSVPGRGRCRQAESPGMSINFSIMCILSCLALSRPLVNRCFAAIQRMWSSKINLALRRGTGRVCWELAGLWIVMWRDRLSSLSPVTSTSYKKKKQKTFKRKFQIHHLEVLFTLIPK